MEEASVALAKMDYLGCEALCFGALVEARKRADWAYYSAILLPLQEARRQRRMIAAEGVVRLGTASLTDVSPAALLQQITAGCIVLTAPHTITDALQLLTAARERRQHVEVLFAEQRGDKWRICSLLPACKLSCEVAPPPAGSTERWLKPSELPAAADWFLDACEALGDAALASVATAAGTVENIASLEACLDIVTDHEILHQRLGAAARGLAREKK